MCIYTTLGINRDRTKWRLVQTFKFLPLFHSKFCDHTFASPLCTTASPSLSRHPLFPNTLPVMEQVKNREKPIAVHYDDSLVLHDQGLQRVLRRSTTERQKLTDRHEKALKSRETKQRRSRTSIAEATSCAIDLENLHMVQLCDFDKQTLQEKLEKHLAALKEAHRKQKKKLLNQHKLEIKQIGAEIISEIGLQSISKSNTIDDRIMKFGSRMRRQLEELHIQEVLSLDLSQNKMQESLVNRYNSQIEQMNISGHTAT